LLDNHKNLKSQLTYKIKKEPLQTNFLSFVAEVSHASCHNFGEFMVWKVRGKVEVAQPHEVLS